MLRPRRSLKKLADMLCLWRLAMFPLTVGARASLIVVSADRSPASLISFTHDCSGSSVAIAAGEPLCCLCHEVAGRGCTASGRKAQQVASNGIPTLAGLWQDQCRMIEFVIFGALLVFVSIPFQCQAFVVLKVEEDDFGKMLRVTCART